MNRLKVRFDRLKEEHKKALAVYLVAGDPGPEITVIAMHKIIDSGADILELGVPFSDPMADGKVIQDAHDRALRSRVSLRDCLGYVREFRKSNEYTPVILMGYTNSFEQMGYPEFASEARDSGVDGVLIVDQSSAESSSRMNVFRKQGIEAIRIIAPTSDESRIRDIVDNGSGFIYYVSLRGTTGGRVGSVEEIEDRLGVIRSFSSLPVLVGFGIRDTISAAKIGEVSDGIVIGSAVVDRLNKAPYGDLSSVSEFVCSVRKSLDVGKKNRAA